MAEAVTENGRTCHMLLIGLKRTAEGLLATSSSNVWSMYGGLERLTRDMERIMTNNLKMIAGPRGNTLDYWNFVQSLRWLNPFIVPKLDEYSQTAPPGKEGATWLQSSLYDLNLSSQLRMLISKPSLTGQHYADDAFLCQPDYVEAMITCLQAIEQNKASLLADVSPALLIGRSPKRKASHIRSVSLPINQISETMIRRSSQMAPHDRLAPILLAAKTDSIVMASNEHATPHLEGSSPDETAKDALLQVLSRSGDSVEAADYPFYSSSGKHDQLMDMRIGAIAECAPGREIPNIVLNAECRYGTNATGTSCANERKDGRRSVRICSEPLDGSTIGGADRSLSRGDMIADCDVCRVGESKDGSGFLTSEKNHGDVTADTAEGVESQKRYTHSRSTSDFGVQSTTPGVRASSKKLMSRSLSSDPRLTDELCQPGRAGFFPQPVEGQSLMSFLSSQDFNTCAELDRENAHFSISEALIAAIEQMKWNQVIRPAHDSDPSVDSDEEIQELKQRIRIRRTERMKEKARGFPAFSDGRTDITMVTGTSTDTTVSPLSSESIRSDSSSKASCSSSDDIEDRYITEIEIGTDSGSSNLCSLRDGGLSLSLGSLYSDAEIKKSNASLIKSLKRQESISRGSISAAESVAISLLRRFSEKHLPKASDLVWLVSEQDAPQALLPLPDSYPVSPDDGENADLRGKGIRTRLRGNLEWAPPRAQIIFNIHSPPKRRILLAKQNFRCAGCGAKVEPDLGHALVVVCDLTLYLTRYLGQVTDNYQCVTKICRQQIQTSHSFQNSLQSYMRRYRYCEYLGKFFCPRCHSNEMATIPARVLHRWDFAHYHVSNFAHDLLRRMIDDPLYNVDDVNPALYQRVKAMCRAEECRVQLYHLKAFLSTCRRGQSQLQELLKMPYHWASDVHLYSLHELIQVRQGSLLVTLQSLVSDSILHVSQCELCQARGFICEYCGKTTDIIFPFDLQRTIQCPVCKSCYHRACHLNSDCPKCRRIEARKKRLREVANEADDSDDDQVT